MPTRIFRDQSMVVCPYCYAHTKGEDVFEGVHDDRIGYKCLNCQCDYTAVRVLKTEYSMFKDCEIDGFVHSWRVLSSDDSECGRCGVPKP